MDFIKPLKSGKLIRRYQRFLATVTCEGEEILAHCPNTGSMMGCQTPGANVWLSPADNPKRRCAWTWELVEAKPGVLVGVHTGRSNALVGEAVEIGLIPELREDRLVRREIKIPSQALHGVGDLEAAVRGRFDWLLEGPAGPCWLEVKNVSAAVEGGCALFPDAVSERASRHALALSRLARQGLRCALIFCVQRGDVDAVRPAFEIDPDYALALTQAAQAGVLVRAIACDISTQAIRPQRLLPVLWK